MQGIPAGFALTAIANYLIGRGMSSVTIGWFDALIGIPWVIQFIWGSLIDRFQFSSLGHRKQWVLGSQILILVITYAIALMKDPASQLHPVAWLFFTHSIFASIQDASVDALAISLVPDREKGKLNAFMRSGLILGTAGGAAGLSTLMHRYGFQTAAIWQFSILTGLTALTWLIKIDRADRYLPILKSTRININLAKASTENPRLQWLFKQLYNGIFAKESLSAFSIMALVYLTFSVFFRSLSFQLIHYLHWPDNDLSVLQGSWALALTIVITLCGGLLADYIGAATLQWRTTIAIGLFYLVFNGLGFLWHYKSFSTAGILVYSLADPIFSVAAMPVLMALCRRRVEGSQFTAYMATVNLCDVIGAYLSGWGMSITTAPVIGVCCGVLIIAAVVVKTILSRRHNAEKFLNSGDS